MNLPYTKYNLLLSLLFKQYIIGNSSHLPDISKSQETFLWNIRLTARRLIVKHWETLHKTQNGCRQIQTMQHTSQLWEMTCQMNNGHEVFSGKPLLLFKSILPAAGKQPHKVQCDHRTAVSTWHVHIWHCFLLPSQLVIFPKDSLLMTKLM